MRVSGWYHDMVLHDDLHSRIFHDLVMEPCMVECVRVRVDRALPQIVSCLKSCFASNHACEGRMTVTSCMQVWCVESWKAVKMDHGEEDVFPGSFSSLSPPPPFILAWHYLTRSSSRSFFLLLCIATVIWARLPCSCSENPCVCLLSLRAWLQCRS